MTRSWRTKGGFTYEILSSLIGSAAAAEKEVAVTKKATNRDANLIVLSSETLIEFEYGSSVIWKWLTPNENDNKNYNHQKLKKMTVR